MGIEQISNRITCREVPPESVKGVEIDGSEEAHRNWGFIEEEKEAVGAGGGVLNDPEGNEGDEDEKGGDCESENQESGGFNGYTSLSLHRFSHNLPRE